MERGKKKEILTPEDRLQAALVPESEQPYPVPGNWCWVCWGVCGDFQAGSAFKNEYQGLTEYKIPFYKVGSLKYSDSNGILYDTSNTVNEEVRIKLKAALIPKSSIIFAKIGEAIRLNRRSINPVPCCIDNNLMSFHAKVCLTKYVYFWSLGIDLYNYTNATTVPAIRKSDLEKVAFPLAPSAEQQRIVDRIESLFAKLDEAKQKAQDALDSFETRKAAILHKAFTGELTAQWRKKHGMGMESWKQIQFSDLTSDVRLGLVRSKAEQSYESLHPYLKMNNITSDGTIDIADIVNVDATEDEVELFALQYGDFLFNTRNSYELVGKNAVWNIDLQNKVLFNNNIMRVRFKHGINPFLVSFYLNSKEGKQKLDKCKKNTTNIAAIYAKNLNQIQIPIMSKDEQTEIVRILDDLLVKEQQAKEAAEGVLEQIDLIKKSILARAFRGELGTNNPGEESAVELLKQVL